MAMEPIAEAVVTFVANAAWQTTVIALAGIVIARLLRRAPAHLRFRLVALTLVASVAAPVMTIIPRVQSSLPRVAQAAAPLRDIVLTPHAAVMASQPIVNRSAAGAIAVIYLAGALLAAFRLLQAARRTRRLLAGSHPFADGVRISDDITSPVTIGRTILIPRSLEGSELLPAALAHERTHVRRRDFAVNALLQLIALPLWFHPIAALLRREIAELRELACDEEAARQSSPRAYAAALIRIASMSAHGDFALGMASTSIERRVATLRQPRAHSRVNTVLAILAIAIIPFGLFAACTRTSITPAIARPALSGKWTIVPSESNFGANVPPGYQTFKQTIVQDARGISVQQHRVANGRAEEHDWHIDTDGRWHAMDIKGAIGMGTWQQGRLKLHMNGPGTHEEAAEVWVSGNRLICDGGTDRGHFHVVFQRED
jgi:beta-lactamase regulating signal transducer with metallopeptidase domain